MEKIYDEIPINTNNNFDIKEYSHDQLDKELQKEMS